MALPQTPPAPAVVDRESQAWIDRLRGSGKDHDEAVRQLHELLLRAARFEVARRRARTPHLRGGDHEDLAQQSADDALVAVLGKLSEFRGESAFTTWAYKFALYEAAATVRRRAWQGREIPQEAEVWRLAEDHGATPEDGAETSEVLGVLREAIQLKLSPRQREVLVAVALGGVPIDVLAQRLHTNRGALYKTIHDARRKLRAALAERGLDIDDEGYLG